MYKGNEEESSSGLIQTYIRLISQCVNTDFKNSDINNHTTYAQVFPFHVLVSDIEIKEIISHEMVSSEPRD